MTMKKTKHWRMRFGTLAVLLALALPLFAQNIDSIAGKKTVFLGDSITQDGRYVTFTAYYLDRLYPQKNFDIYGLGLSSETLSGLSETNHAGGAFPRPCLFERLGRLLEAVKPEVVIACYGMNDGIYQPLDPERFMAFKRGVTNLIEQCKAAGVKEIFLVTPPIFDYPPNAPGFNYDSVLTEYAAWEMTLKISGVQVIDLHTAMRKARATRAGVFSKDRIHPGDEGHLLMAKTILAGLNVQVPDESLATIQADPLYKHVDVLRRHRSTRWLNHVGYTRGKTITPQPLGDTETEAAKLQQTIDALRRLPVGLRAVGVEKDERLHPDGKGWRLDQAKIVDRSRPRVLLVGDSILGGYFDCVKAELQGKVYVDAWMNPYWQSDTFNKLLGEALENGPYNVVHLNTGLHGWSPGRIKPGTFEPLTRAMIGVIRAKCPQAKIIWASSTPVTTKSPAPIALHPEINPNIIDQNCRAAKVMAELNVPVNDFYALLVDKLDLARGDQFHWKNEAYPILGKACAASIMKEIKQ